LLLDRLGRDLGARAFAPRRRRGERANDGSNRRRHLEAQPAARVRSGGPLPGLDVGRFCFTSRNVFLGAAMDELTVTATGQITLSEELLDHLGVSSGQRVSVEKLPGGRIEMRAAGPMGKISDTFGCLKREG